MILAVETATGACSVALSNGSETYTRYSEQARAHSQLAMGMVDAVLAEAGCNVRDIEGLGVTIGPGSFTGLRIGFSIIQGLAFAMDLPVAPVSTLKTLVATYQRGRGDARKIGIFSGVGRSHGSICGRGLSLERGAVVDRKTRLSAFGKRSARVD